MDAEQAVHDLADSVRLRKLVPFCGAGVSRGANPPLPGAQEFLREQGKAGLPWPLAASALEAEPGFRRKFQIVFAARREPSEQHKLLACLDAPYYITTNYDELLESSLARVHTPRKVGIIRTPDVSEAFSYRNLVIKLHGDVQSADLMVFTDQQYRDRLKQRTSVDDLVRLLFATHDILFVGYGLDDSHIIDALEASGQIPMQPRRRYIVLPSLDRKMKTKLQRLGVVPVVLAGQGDFGDAVCEFLHRLWEQHDHLGSYTSLIEKAPQTVDGMLRHAMVCRQDGRLVDADSFLSRLFEQGVEKFNLGLLPGLLWLMVSVRDKLEKWDGLEEADRTFATALFADLQNRLPRTVVDSLRAAYKSSLAVAFTRSGNYAKAGALLASVGRWRCTGTANRGLQIVTADLLTTMALVQLHAAIAADDQRSADQSLQKAEDHLASAWEIFDRHARRGQPDESHHLGRFFGTRAFLRIARANTRGTANGLTSAAIDDLLNDARSAHEPGDCRTQFGRLAGRYCDAACNYWLARNVRKSPDRIAWIARARNHVKAIMAEVDKRQVAARFKISMLSGEVARLDGQPSDLQRMQDGVSTLPAPLQSLVKELKLKWLLLPLN